MPYQACALELDLSGFNVHPDVYKLCDLGQFT